MDPSDDPYAAFSASPAGLPRQLGPYVLEEELGRGGMGGVYRVRHVELGAVRALKLMLRPESRQAVARFEREIEHLAKVRHRNVVRIHEAGVDAGRAWFVMDRVEGEPLDRLLQRGRLPLGRALELAAELADGVAALHAAGVIHRDLKPQNVVVTPDGRPVVLDLGLALAPEHDQRLTKSGATLGTVTYMAPEQLRTAHQVTPATDVYALGLIAFELATGERAVPQGSSAHEVMVRILTTDPPAPSSVDPGLPAALDAVVARATARDPARRHPGATELAAALRQLAADPGVSPRQRRRRAHLVAALLVLAAAPVVVALALRSAGHGSSAGPVGAVGSSESGAAVDSGLASGARSPSVDRATELEAAARAELEAARALGPAPRARALEAWLARWPQHPAAADARRRLAQTHLTTPARVLADSGAAGACFLPPDDLRALTYGRGGAVFLWDLRSGEAVGGWELGWRVLALALAPDLSGFVCAGEGGQVMWVDLEGNERRPLAPISFLALDAAMSPDGRLVAVGGRGDEVLVLELPSGAVRARLRGHRSAVWRVAFAPDGQRLATGSGDSYRADAPVENAVRLWDVASGERVARVPFLAQVHDLAYSPDGRRIAVACDGARIVLLDADTGAQVQSLTGDEVGGDGFTQAPAHRGIARATAYGADGRLLFTAAGDVDHGLAHELRVWDASSGGERHRVSPLAARPSRIQVSASRPGWVLVSGGGRAELWDLSALGAAPR